MKEHLSTITNKQKEIISLIYRYRYLNRTHIQTLLSHKSPTLINQWLKDLTEKQYLTRIYSSKFGENTKPAIYHINTNGIRFLKYNHIIDIKQAQNLYHENLRSQVFQTHSLTLADFACNLFTHAKKEIKKAELLTKSDLSEETEDEILLFLQELKPDAYYTYNGTGIPKAGFVEIIDEHIPTFVLRHKMRRYVKALNDIDWEVLNVEKFPSLIFILPTMKKLRSLQQVIKRVRNEFDEDDTDEKLRCNLSLASDIQSKSLTDNIWLKA